MQERDSARASSHPLVVQEHPCWARLREVTDWDLIHSVVTDVNEVGGSVEEQNWLQPVRKTRIRCSRLSFPRWKVEGNCTGQLEKAVDG